MRAPLAALALIALTAGCGSTASPSKRSAPAPGSLESLWRNSGRVFRSFRARPITRPASSASPSWSSTRGDVWSPHHARVSGLLTRCVRSPSPRPSRSWSQSGYRASRRERTPRRSMSRTFACANPGRTTSWPGRSVPSVSAASGAAGPKPHGVPTRRLARIPVAHAHACRQRWRRVSADDPCTAGPSPAAHVDRGCAACARTVRRDVRDAALLREPGVRARRRRGRRTFASATDTQGSASSTSRSTPATTRQRTPTSGCANGTCRVSPGRSSSDVTAGLRRNSKARCRQRARAGNTAVPAVVCDVACRLRTDSQTSSACVRSRTSRVHPETIRRLIHDGRLDAVRVGRVLRVHREAVDHFLFRQRVKPPRLSD